LAGHLNLIAPPDTIEKWVETALKQNFGLQSKLYDMSSAQKNIGIQRTGHYPIIQADGSASKGKTAPPNPTVANTNTIGVTVSVPIYAGGSITSQTRQAAFEYEVSLQAKIAAERELVSNTRQAYRGIYTQISQVEALKQTVVSSKSALDATQAAFNVGTRTIVDVLDAETDLLNAQRSLSTSRYDYILESFRLKRYAGILALNDMEIINRMLEPAADDAG
jgi:outer membrane protein